MLTPLEALAFQTLGLLRAEDIQPLAMSWLEAGLGGDAVAALAIEPAESVRATAGLFREATTELGEAPLSDREAVWVVAGVYLQRLVVEGLDGRSFVDLFNLHIAHYADVLGRTDYPPYAGQELGIEQLVGLYSVYDPDRSAERNADYEQAVRTEAQHALDRFYSAGSKLPEELKSVSIRRFAE